MHKFTCLVISGFIILLSGCGTHPTPDLANTYGQTIPIADSIIRNAFAGREGALVIIDCSSGAISDFRPNAAAERVAPCVPAFQALARQIGPERMQSWIEKLGYGDRDTSAGIDVFWLPAKGRKTILISPVEQARLMHRLVAGKLPFSKTSLAVLKEMMVVKKTDNGVLFGKTGSGTDDRGTFVLGWFVGYVESNEKTYAFACTAQGEGIVSKDARAIVETVLEKQGLL